MGELIELTGTQKARLKKWLKERITEWEQDTEDLHQNLLYDNDLVEGIVYDTDFPWENASNVHVPMTEIYMEIYKSILKRSMLNADSIWYAETDSNDETIQDMLADIGDMLDYRARNEWNIEEKLKEVCWLAPRDGLAAIEVTWEERYEKSSDIVLIGNEGDFIELFPSPEEAGVTEEEWFRLAEQAQQASDEQPLEVPMTFEKQVYRGCKGDAVELVNFVTIPATVPSIRHELCRGYGKRYTTRSNMIRQAVRDGRYYKDEAEELLGKGESYQTNEFLKAQDEMEGLRRSNTKGMYLLYDLNVRVTLNGFGKEETGDERYNEEMQFSVVYDRKHDKLLRCVEYVYRCGCHYATFTTDSRPNRLVGKSVPNKTRDTNDEMDTQHNQRINARTITTLPVFKGQASKKDELSLELRQNRWAPGKTIWLQDFNSYDQFKIQPTDQGESMSEEKNSQGILDLYLGSAASLLSGGAPTQDPNAPGNKTAMMIGQSNLRMDDPLDEMRKGVEQVGDICLSHVYQFDEAVIPFRSAVEGGGQQTKTIYKKFLRKGIRMKMSGMTVTLNPEIEMQKAAQTHMLLMNEPLYANDPELRIEGLRYALRAGRIRNRNRLLPPLEKIKQMQAEAQARAMTVMEQQKQQAMQQQAQEAQKAKISQVKQALDIKNTASKVAETGLSLSPPVSAMSNGNVAVNGSLQNGQ